MSKQLIFNMPHRVLRARADFLVAESNRAALELVHLWPRWQQPVMALIGEEACGKTHLASVWQQRSQAQSLYDSSSARHCLADDIDKNLAHFGEKKLFALLNQIMRGEAQQRSLLLTASHATWWHEVKLADLRSRLATISIVEIAAPDDALISAVLVKLFADRQLSVSESLCHWLLLRMERSFAGAQRIVDRLDKESVARQKPITIALAREVLF